MTLGVELRTILQTGGDDTPLRPAELLRIAGKALHGIPGLPPGLEPHDLLGDYLAELLERGRAVQDDLLGRHPDQLEAAVYNRLRQLALDASPGWDRYRALKGHVTAVLAETLPTPPRAAPVKLTEGEAERLSRPRVREAVAWLLHTSAPPPADPVRITRLLMQAYFPPAGPPDQDAPDPSLRSDARIRHDAGVLADALGQHLPPEPLRVLAWLYEGRPLRSIAADLGVSIPAAWERKRSALESVRTLMEQHGITTARTVAEALARLHADPRVRDMLGFYDSSEIRVLDKEDHSA